MKKKLSLVLAVVMAASMLAGCKKTDESSAGLPDITPEATSSLTQMTTEATTTEAITTTEATTTTTEATTTDTEPEPETTEASESETAASSETAETSSSKWSETELDEVFYIKENCYSRKAAIVGSEAVKQYTVGQKIIVIAATDTGYYKLEDGTFIHSDYLSEEKPENVPSAPSTTSAKPAEEITVPDDKPTGGSKPISSSYKKDYKDRYPYQQLSSAEKQLYANIVEAAENFSPTAKVPEGISGEDVYKVYVLVFNHEPQLFWLSLTPPRAFAGEMNISYALSPDEAASTQKKIDSTVKNIMSKVAGYTSTTSKLKVIYDWVIQNNTFSLNSNISSCSVYTSLTGGGQLQCQGYAKTVQYLCDVAGIDCMVVTGTNADGDSHAWNVVYCDNGYYILDTTWGDPYGLSYAKSDYERYYFFLANDEMIKNTHKHVSMAYRNDEWIKLYNPPACTKSACYYFKAYNKEYSDYNSALAALKKEIDDAISSGKQVAHIRVTDKKLYDKLRSTEVWKDLISYAQKKSSKVDRLSRQTSLTEDILVVHYDVVYK